MGGLDYCAETGERLTRFACCRCRGCALSLLANFPTRLLREELAFRASEPNLYPPESAVDLLASLARAPRVEHPLREAP